MLQEFLVGPALNSFDLCLADFIYLQVHIKQPHILCSVGIALSLSDGPTTRTICASVQSSEKHTTELSNVMTIIIPNPNLLVRFSGILGRLVKP